MAYSDYNTLVDTFGANEVILAFDKGGDGIADVALVARCLDDASNEIDSYIGAVYKLPIIPVPGVLITHAGVIAIYRASLSTGVYTVEKRQRYEDTIKWLRDVAAGKAVLDGAVQPDMKSGTIRYTTQPREFTRTTLAGIL